MTTITMADFNLSPDIVLGHEERRRLMLLAMAGSGHTADDSDALLYELERARTVPDEAVPANVVRIGSLVRYRAASGGHRTVEVVYPKDADISNGKISVLTPVGTALIGLRAGQSITWLARDGRKQVLTVQGVTPPSDDDPGPMAA